MKKLRLIGLALLSISILYVVAFYISAQNYKAWCEERPYDYYPFWASNQGKPMILIGLVLFISWVGFLSFRLDTFISKRKRKMPITALALVALSISLCFTTLPVAHASYTEKYVDVLVVRDEEWKAGWGHCHIPGIVAPLPLPYNETAKTAMKLVAEGFNETFGIEIRWHYWVEWDSDDGKQIADDLLDEAIRETGFEPGMSYNGYIIDVLTVFTGQDLYDEYGNRIHGWSPPEWKALIIEYITHEDENESLQHEFSHQYYAPHCSNWCVMNVEAIFNLFNDVDCWCSGCQVAMQPYLDRFTRPLGEADVTVLRGTLLNPLYFEGRTSVEVDGEYIGNTPITFSALEGGYVNIQVKYEVWTRSSIWRLQYYEVIDPFLGSYNETVYYPNGWDIDVYVGSSSPITVIAWYDYVGRPPSEDPPPGGGGGGGGGGNYPLGSP